MKNILRISVLVAAVLLVQAEQSEPEQVPVVNVEQVPVLQQDTLLVPLVPVDQPLQPRVYAQEASDAEEDSADQEPANTDLTYWDYKKQAMKQYKRSWVKKDSKEKYDWKEHWAVKKEGQRLWYCVWFPWKC